MERTAVSRTGNEGRSVQNLPVASESSVATASVNTRPADRQCAILRYGQVDVSVYIYMAMRWAWRQISHYNVTVRD
jgi:hypothetical protein